MNSLKRRGMETFCVLLIFIGITILVLVLSTLFFAARPQQYNLVDIMHTSQGCDTNHPNLISSCLHDTTSLKFSLNCEACHNTRQTLDQDLQPWLQELSCDRTCHGSSQVMISSRIWESRLHE